MENLHKPTLNWLNIAKTALFGALLLGVTIPAMAESHLVVYFTNGSATSFVVDDKPHVSFSENEILIRAKDMSTEYPVASVRKFAFADKSGLVSPELIDNEVRFTYTDRDCLGACGLKSNEPITLYRTDGTCALTTKANADGNAEIDLSNLEPGIYIVNTASKTFKIQH